MKRTAEGMNIAGEGDRATVKANDMVIDVIANDDGTVYIEIYAYDGNRKQAIVRSTAIDCYRDRHPNLSIELTDRLVLN